MEVTLVFPHQLFAAHPAVGDRRPVYLVEDPLFFGPDPAWPLRFHAQKLVLHRASMKAYADRLESGGHEVHYLDCPMDDTVDTGALLESALPRDISVIHVCDPVDDVLTRRLRRFADQRGSTLESYPCLLYTSDAADE